MTKQRTELATIEQGQIALENVVSNTQIASLMSEVGIGGEQIDVGKNIVQSASDAYHYNEKENRETLIAHKKFDAKLTDLKTLYRAHRKKSKVIFKEDYELMMKLDLVHAIPKDYLSLMNSIELFYNELNTNETAKNQLLGFKVSQDDISTATALHAEVKTLRKVYLDLRGKSQSATKSKDQAMKKLDKWMRDFFAIAKIAFEDSPQLLESLGKKVKS